MRNRTVMINEVLAIQSELESINLRISSQQSIHDLIDLGGVIAGWMAFTGEQMANAKAYWRQVSQAACESGVKLKDGAGDYVKTPSIVTKYIQSLTGYAEADYEFIERVNKSCTHTLDFLRSCISALKEEQKAYSFNGGIS